MEKVKKIRMDKEDFETRFFQDILNTKIQPKASSEEIKGGIRIKVYKKRWLMLFLYVAYMVCNSSQWLQYSIVSNVMSKFYGVSEWTVNLTSLIMMICYIIFSMPAAYLLDRLSLRSIALLGVGGTSLGSWIKVFSASPDRFYVTFAGQTVVALAQVLMLSVPQKLSSTWFGENEVATACSIGVFGFQAGIVIGFFVPPLLIKDHITIAHIGDDLYLMFLLFAGVTTFVGLLVLFAFESEPKFPPTRSQAMSRKLNSEKTKNIWKMFKVFRNKRFLAMFILTGVNNGCFNGLSTLLSQIFLHYFAGMEQDAGRVGVTMVISGMLASVIYGCLLDKTKLYKFILIAVYYMSGVAMILFAYCLESGRLLYAYVGASIVGTFLCGFTAVSFDVATELTYPESEVIVGTIMNTTSLIFSFLTTIIFGMINDHFGFFWGNIGFVVTLIGGATLMLPIKFELKRLEAQNQKKDLEMAPLYQ